MLSFTLSIWLWLYVQVQDNPRSKAPTSYLVKVDLLNVPTDIVPSDPGTIRFFPKGLAEDLSDIKNEDLSAYVDLSGARPDAKTQRFPVRLVVKGHDAVSWNPSKPVAVMTIQRKLTKMIDVKVQPSGDLENPDHLYLPKSTFTEPGKIEVSGPEADVLDVSSARAILDLSRVGPGKTQESDLELLRDDDLPAPSTVKSETTKVTIHPGIAVGLDFVRLPVIARYTGKPAPGFVVKQVVVVPADVQVRGRPEDLRSLTHLEMDPSIDVSGFTESRTFTLTPRLPVQGVALVGQPTITAKVIIEPAPKAPIPPNNPRRRGGE